MENNDWTLVSSEERYKGRITIVNKIYRTPSDETRTYEVIEYPPVVCILALTHEREAVLVRQFRQGPERFCTELPAGFVDAGESPADAAARELYEETGFQGTLQPVGDLVTDGYSTEIRHVFACSDAQPGDTPHRDDNEDLIVVIVGIGQLRQILRRGEMTVTDAAYLAMDALGLLSSK